jgi:hypothetical protein
LCRSEDGIGAEYLSFRNGIAVDGAFHRLTSNVDIPSSRSGSCDDGPYRGAWEVDGKVIGQIACWISDGLPVLLASDKRVAILFDLAGGSSVAGLAARLPKLAPVP